MLEKTENNNQLNWYILVVLKGKEETVVKKINSELDLLKIRKGDFFSSKIKELIPIKSERCVLCNLEIDEDLLYFIYKFSGIVGFLGHERGSGILPKFINYSRVSELLKKREEKKIIFENKEKEDFKKDDRVQINKGLFQSYEGKITRVNYKKSRIDIDLDYDGKNDLLNTISLKNIPLDECSRVSSSF